LKSKLSGGELNVKREHEEICWRKSQTRAFLGSPRRVCNPQKLSPCRGIPQAPHHYWSLRKQSKRYRDRNVKRLTHFLRDTVFWVNTAID
jgi:hypothetical protein